MGPFEAMVESGRDKKQNGGKFYQFYADFLAGPAIAEDKARV